MTPARVYRLHSWCTAGPPESPWGCEGDRLSQVASLIFSPYHKEIISIYYSRFKTNEIKQADGLAWRLPNLYIAKQR